MAIDKEVYEKTLAEEKKRLEAEKMAKVRAKSIAKAKRDALGLKKYLLALKVIGRNTLKVFKAVSIGIWKGTNKVFDAIEKNSKKAGSQAGKKMKNIKIKENKDPFGMKDLENSLK